MCFQSTVSIKLLCHSCSFFPNVCFGNPLKTIIFVLTSKSYAIFDFLTAFTLTPNHRSWLFTIKSSSASLLLLYKAPYSKSIILKGHTRIDSICCASFLYVRVVGVMRTFNKMKSRPVHAAPLISLMSVFIRRPDSRVISPKRTSSPGIN